MRAFLFRHRAAYVFVSTLVFQSMAHAVSSNDCLMVLGRSFDPVPEAIYLAEGEPELTLGDLEVTDNAGRLQVLSRDKTKAYVLTYSHDGPLKSVLSVSRGGTVFYYNYEEGYRNGARLGLKEGERLLTKFEELITAGDPGTFLRYQVERQRPNIMFLNRASRLWPKAEVLPATPWELNKPVASFHRFASGLLAILVEPYGRKVTLLQFDHAPFDQIPKAELVLYQDGNVTNENYLEQTRKTALISARTARDVIVEVVAILSQKRNPLALSLAATHIENTLKRGHPELFD